jgi:hypothetical protein
MTNYYAALPMGSSTGQRTKQHAVTELGLPQEALTFESRLSQSSYMNTMCGTRIFAMTSGNTFGADIFEGASCRNCVRAIAKAGVKSS